MRIDKYLKLTRLIKRRTVAKELLDRGLFKINDKIAKPSSEVEIGDHILLVLGRRILEIEVLMTCDYCKKEESNNLYKIIREEIIPNAEIR
ncbi:MAG: RNA-binding S4 domain-containing protein [Candidatus Onthovivens sp.]|nr:RNA-binding S4 domain-containing protein [Mollicutes bacterium]MDY4857879.1 RNA-binding S4 domain-containing protein [Candidatus Onthovivens sp.]MDY4937476.1 RNA-binding S4 domain-containing protein [Candidatus Onthovivens sp.]